MKFRRRTLGFLAGRPVWQVVAGPNGGAGAVGHADGPEHVADVGFHGMTGRSVAGPLSLARAQARRTGDPSASATWRVCGGAADVEATFSRPNPSKVGADGAQGVPHLSGCGEALGIGGGACLDEKLRKLRA
jgi:hypothetical protein